MRVPKLAVTGTALVALTAGLLASPTTVHADDRVAWWCLAAADASLDAHLLPAFLPASACSLVGRTIATGTVGVEVPPVGLGVVSPSTGDEERLYVWTDAAGTHIGGDATSAARGYLVDLAHGAGSADLRGKAESVRAVVWSRAGDYRADPSYGELLDAADRLVDATRGGVPLDAHGFDGLSRFLDDIAGAVVEGMPGLDELHGRMDGYQDDMIAGRDVVADQLLTDLVASYAVVHVGLVGAPNPVGSASDLLDLHMLEAIRVLREKADDMITATDGWWAEHSDTLTDMIDFLDGHDATLDEVTVTANPEPELGPDPTDGLVAAATGGPAACRDSYWKPILPSKPRWPRGTRILWYYNKQYQPSYYTDADYRWAIGRGFGNMTGMKDDCGFAWRPNILHGPQGLTTARPGMYYDAGGKAVCRPSDGKNVVGWLSFLSTDRAIGRACPTFDYTGTRILAGDIALNTRYVYDIPEQNYKYGSTCNRYATNGDFDVEGLITHEFGHVLGLADLDEATQGYLTMSAMINARCGRSERTPGLGDANGLAYYYGKIY